MEVLCEDLAKVYNGKKVLNIDRLAVKKGSLLGVIGANGSGKSTLLSVIAGIIEPSAGKVLYGGIPAGEHIMKNITMVFQRPFMLKTTVANNIGYPLKIRGLSGREIKERTAAIMEEFSLSPLSGQKAWTLSGGEKQKVALARALIFKPELLLLDEPTASIDRQSIKVLERGIIKASENGTTIIIVTHSISQAVRLCTDVVFMYGGEICESGEARKLVYSPKHPHTREFIEDFAI